MGAQGCPEKGQESCIWTQCFTKNVLDIVSTRLCFIHELWERVDMNSPHTNSHPQSPHFRFEKQIETGQTWCFCTKKKIDWAEATAKAYKWRLWNTGFWLAESIWSQPIRGERIIRYSNIIRIIFEYQIIRIRIRSLFSNRIIFVFVFGWIFQTE